MSLFVPDTLAQLNGGTFGIVDSSAVIGGFHIVATLTARNNIPTGVRAEGMFAYVLSNTTLYVLSADLVTWTTFSGGGGGGVDESRFVTGVAPIGSINSSNTVFTTADKFVHTVGGLSIAVYYSGARMKLTNDYTLSESGGVGTGFDTITFVSAPLTGDKVIVDYVIAA